MYFRGTPCWLPKIDRSFSRAAASSAAASSFENGCHARPMRKRPLIRKAFIETAWQGTAILKTLAVEAWSRRTYPGSLRGLRLQRGLEVLHEVFRNLPGDALHRHQGFRRRLGEVLRGLEARIEQRSRPGLADAFDREEGLDDVAFDQFRRREFEDSPLDRLIPGADLERLRERPLCVVVPPHLHEDLGLGRPRLLVVRIELGKPIERLERPLPVAFLEQDVPAVQDRGRVDGLHPKHEVEAVQRLLRFPAPAVRNRFADEGVHVARLDFEDFVERGERLPVVAARAPNQCAAQQSRYVHANLFDLLAQILVRGIDRGGRLVRRQRLRSTAQIREGVSLHLEARGIVRPNSEEILDPFEAFAPPTVFRVEADQRSVRLEVLRVARDDPLVCVERLRPPVQSQEARRLALEREDMPRFQSQCVLERREPDLEGARRHESAGLSDEAIGRLRLSNDRAWGGPRRLGFHWTSRGGGCRWRRGFRAHGRRRGRRRETLRYRLGGFHRRPIRGRHRRGVEALSRVEFPDSVAARFSSPFADRAKVDPPSDLRPGVQEDEEWDGREQGGDHPFLEDEPDVAEERISVPEDNGPVRVRSPHRWFDVQYD